MVLMILLAILAALLGISLVGLALYGVCSFIYDEIKDRKKPLSEQKNLDIILDWD